jgi:pyruvate/2-oxoglutarate dehydrogenase complex dihydrolipoamide acyltransferase (E2) component
MNANITSYHIVELTPWRRAFLNTFNLPRPKHSMFGLLEVDVTDARQFIAEHKQYTGETLSFTGYLTYCLAQAVKEDNSVQSYLKGRKQLVVFDDVDVGLMIERQIGEKRVLTGYVIRGANYKTYQQIHQEIRTAQSDPVPPGEGIPHWFRSAMLLPWPLSRVFIAIFGMILRRDPTMSVEMQGSVGITAVGMFGKGHSGFGLQGTRHSLDLIVGSTTWKPAVIGGRIEPRQILNLTVVFDHDVIDGAPAARFVSRLVELIESGSGLGEIDEL